MSNAVNKLGGKCPYMPFLGRVQMSGGEHVRPPGGGGGRVCVREQGFDEHILRSWGERQFSFREKGTKPPSPNPVGSK